MKVLRGPATVLFGKTYVWHTVNGKLSLEPDWEMRYLFTRSTARAASNFAKGPRL
jgi:hypothetical protein